MENKPKPAEALSRKKALLLDPALNLARSESILFLSESSHWTFGGQCHLPDCQLLREREREKRAFMPDGLILFIRYVTVIDSM